MRRSSTPFDTQRNNCPLPAATGHHLTEAGKQCDYRCCLHLSSIARTSPRTQNTQTRIAIPIADGRLAQHLGHCEKFALVDVDAATKEISASTEVAAPEHQPGLLPPWLNERGVNLVIAGGMGARAHSLFQEASIEVLTGAPAESAATLVLQYLEGKLVPGENACDH
jgi:ATP-binding protein involved in chromosome partitioning